MNKIKMDSQVFQQNKDIRPNSLTSLINQLRNFVMSETKNLKDVYDQRIQQLETWNLKLINFLKNKNGITFLLTNV